MRRQVQVLVPVKKYVMKITQSDLCRRVCRACWLWLTEEGELKPTERALDEAVGAVALPSCSVANGVVCGLSRDWRDYFCNWVSEDITLPSRPGSVY